MLRCFEESGGVRLTALSPAHVVLVQSQPEFSPAKYAAATRKLRLYALRWWLKALMEAGAADLRSYVAKTGVPQPRNMTLTPEQVAGMLSHPDPCVRWLSLCGLHCGLRYGTATKVTMGDCNGGLIRRLTKAGRQTEVPVSAPMAALLSSIVTTAATCDWPVIDLLNGRRLWANGYRWRWRQAAKSLGMEGIHPHDMRRTLARAYYAETGDLRQVQRLLGHSHLWSTIWYMGQGTMTPLNTAALDAARRQKSE